MSEVEAERREGGREREGGAEVPSSSSMEEEEVTPLIPTGEEGLRGEEGEGDAAAPAPEGERVEVVVVEVEVAAAKEVEVAEAEWGEGGGAGSPFPTRLMNCPGLRAVSSCACLTASAISRPLAMQPFMPTSSYSCRLAWSTLPVRP